MALFRSLSENELGEQTGIALGEALKTNTSLQNLKYVPWCPISISTGVLVNHFCPCSH